MLDEAITNSESASHPEVIRNLRVVARTEHRYLVDSDSSVRDVDQPYLHFPQVTHWYARPHPYMYIPVCRVPARHVFNPCWLSGLDNLWVAIAQLGGHIFF